MAEDEIIFINGAELLEKAGQGEIVVIDVREPEDFRNGHIDGAINMPAASLDFDRMIDLTDETDADLVFVCAVGQRSFGAATAALAHVDCDVFNLHGGLKAWTRDGLDLVEG